MGAPKGGSLPYARRRYLFSAAERSFYGVLRWLLPEHTIFAKVRMSDLLNVPKGTEGWQTHFNRIQSKHGDFVVCNADLAPVLAIELDDASHKRAERQERDDFVNDAFAAAGLPLAHIVARRGYALDEVHAILSAHLNAASSVEAGPE